MGSALDKYTLDVMIFVYNKISGSSLQKSSGSLEYYTIYCV